MAFLTAIIFADLFLQLIPIWIFSVLIISFQILYCNKYENAFIFILFTPVIAGILFNSQGVSGIGGFFIPLGLILIWKNIYKARILLIKGFVPLSIIFILFVFSAYFNDGGDYFANKLLNTLTYGTLSYIAFAILLMNRGSVRSSLLAVTFLLLGIFLLRLAIDINNLPGPSNLFHFGFLRDQGFAYSKNSLVSIDDFTFSYHLPGFLSLVGLSFFLTDSKKYSKPMNWYVWIVAFIIIFYTGARQNLLAYIVLLIFFILMQKKYSIIFKFMAIGTVGVVSTLILLSINSEVIQNVLLSSSITGAIEVSGRTELMNRGLELFNTSPLWGVGFGHYNFRGIFESFPHNIIVELLAEVGVIGFSFILILCCYVVYKSHKLSFQNKHNFRPYFVLLPLFVRAMISGSMTTNIIVFSFIFSLYFLKLDPT
jgi:hypothetical protein